MKIRKTALYEHFHCVGGTCPDTCCGGWTISIDEESLDYYAGLRGPFGRQVAGAIDWRGACFWQEKNRCLLLTEDGLCSLHKKLGEEALCDTCREFPRHMEEFLGILEYHVNLSCPEVVRLLLTMDDPLWFTECESEEEQNWDEEELEAYDPTFFGTLEGLRQSLLEKIRQAEQSDCTLEKLQTELLTMAAGKEILFDPASFEWKLQGRKLLEDMIPVRDSWISIRQKLKEKVYEGGWKGYSKRRAAFLTELSQHQGEQALWRKAVLRILACCINLYLPGAVYDGWIFTKAALGVLVCSLLEDFFLLQFEEQGTLPKEDTICLGLCALMRELEHNDDNLNAAEEYLDAFFFPDAPEK